VGGDLTQKSLPTITSGHDQFPHVCVCVYCHLPAVACGFFTNKKFVFQVIRIGSKKVNYTGGCIIPMWGEGGIVAHPVLWAFCFLWFAYTQISRSLTNCWPNLYPIRPRILLLLLVGRAIEKGFFSITFVLKTIIRLSPTRRRRRRKKHSHHHLSLTSLGMLHQLNKESIFPSS
jgi:hypothetical protein